MITQATKFLDRKKVSYEVVKYDHQEKGAVYASKAIGFDLERTIKTLIVDLGPGGYVMALMPGDKELDLKRMAKACSAKRASMADVSTAERLTGYLVGGISPFGVKKMLPAVMESRLAQYEMVAINAGRRGVMLKMKPDNIIKTLKCRVLQIAQDD